MAGKDDEDERLRSAALQNARSVLLARQRAEEALRKQSEWLCITLASIGDAVFSTDREGRVTFMNGVAESLTGWTQPEALGRPLPEIFHIVNERSRERVENPALRALQEGTIVGLANHRLRRGERIEQFETVRLSKDGRRLDISLTVSPLRDHQGHVIGASKVARDMTGLKQAEAALKQSEERLAVELEATTRLHALSTRLVASMDLPSALDDVLQEAIKANGADFGNIQLYSPQHRELMIVAQRGFRAKFLDHFRTVRIDEGSACAQATTSGERIIIEDVELDPSFEPHRQIAAAAGFRGVQSTPLKSRKGSVIGMLSTHFARPHRPSERDLRLLDLHARHAADLIERDGFEESLRRSESPAAFEIRPAWNTWCWRH